MFSMTGKLPKAGFQWYTSGCVRPLEPKCKKPRGRNVSCSKMYTKSGFAGFGHFPAGFDLHVFKSHD